MGLFLRVFFGGFAFLAVSGNATSVCMECGIEKVIETYRANRGLSGTLFIQRGVDEWIWPLDLADDEEKTPNGADTVFGIASISKGFVAAAILKLEESGQLKLSDRLCQHIPEWPKDLCSGHGEEITLMHLLHHTSGMPEAYEAAVMERKLDRVSVRFDDFLQAVASGRLAFRPGSNFAYSNTGYVLLGEVVKRASGMGYADFLTQTLLTPTNLYATTIGPPRGLRRGLVSRSYERQGDQRIDYQRRYKLKSVAADEVLADTNIYTNAVDLAVWVRAVTSGKILSPSSTERMLTPNLASYGLGWSIGQDRFGAKFYEHAGSYGAYRSGARRYPDSDTTVIWLSNQAIAESRLEAFFEAICQAAVNPK